jgi:hypothetical protein
MHSLSFLERLHCIALSIIPPNLEARKQPFESGGFPRISVADPCFVKGMARARVLVSQRYIRSCLR